MIALALFKKKLNARRRREPLQVSVTRKKIKLKNTWKTCRIECSQPRISAKRQQPRNTPLHAAAIRGHDGCVLALLRAGASIVALDLNNGKTALELCTWTFHNDNRKHYLCILYLKKARTQVYLQQVENQFIVFQNPGLDLSICKKNNR